MQTHDPKATDSARLIFGDRVMYAADPYSAAHGVDALLVLTEWLVYRNPDFERVRKLVRRPLLIDGRNLYDPDRMAALGLRLSRDRPGPQVTRVLITGAAGFIGSHLVQALYGQGDEVVGIDNFDPFYPRAMKERNLAEIGRPAGFTFRELDLLDVTALRALLTPNGHRAPRRQGRGAAFSRRSGRVRPGQCHRNRCCG